MRVDIADLNLPGAQCDYKRHQELKSPVEGDVFITTLTWKRRAVIIYQQSSPTQKMEVLADAFGFHDSIEFLFKQAKIAFHGQQPDQLKRVQALTVHLFAVYNVNTRQYRN